MGGVPEKEIVLHHHPIRFKIWVPIFSNQQKIRTARTFPVQEDISPDGNIPTTRFAIVISVAIFNYDIAGGIVSVAPAASGEVIEENIILNDHVTNAVDVDVFVGARLVVEHITFHKDIRSPIIYLQDIVVVAVVENVVSKSYTTYPLRTARLADEILYLNDERPCPATGVGDIKTLQRYSLALETGNDGAAMTQLGLVGHL